MGYEKQNHLEILTPESYVTEGLAHALHLTYLDDQARKARSGPPSFAARMTAQTDDKSAQCPLMAEGSVRESDGDPKNPAGNLGK